MQQVIESYDVLGLGFGPANLAIAAVITEKWSLSQVSLLRLLQPSLYLDLTLDSSQEWPRVAYPQRSFHREAFGISLAPWDAHPRLANANQVRTSMQILIPVILTDVARAQLLERSRDPPQPFILIHLPLLSPLPEQTHQLHKPWIKCSISPRVRRLPCMGCRPSPKERRPCRIL